MTSVCPMERWLVETARTRPGSRTSLSALPRSRARGVLPGARRVWRATRSPKTLRTDCTARAVRCQHGSDAARRTTLDTDPSAAS